MQAGSLRDRGIWNTSAFLVSHHCYPVITTSLALMQDCQQLRLSHSVLLSFNSHILDRCVHLKLPALSDLTLSAKHFASAGQLVQSQPPSCQISRAQELCSAWHTCPRRRYVLQFSSLVVWTRQGEVQGFYDRGSLPSWKEKEKDWSPIWTVLVSYYFK